MNITSKVYCRIFQFGFKVAIPFLPYRNPDVLNKADQVPEYLKKNGKKFALI